MMTRHQQQKSGSLNGAKNGTVSTLTSTRQKIPIDTLVDYLLYSCLSLFAIAVAICMFFDQVQINKYNEISTIENFLSDDICNRIIQVAEGFGKWETERHASYPTTDIPVRSMNVPISLPYTIAYSTLLAVNPNKETHDIQPSYDENGEVIVNFSTWTEKYIVNDQVFPLIRHMYPNIVQQYDTLSVQDLFLVKYDADDPNSQKELMMHTDASMFSFNIALNSPLSLSSAESTSEITPTEVVTSSSEGSEDEFAEAQEQEQKSPKLLPLQQISKFTFEGGGTKFRICEDQGAFVNGQGSLMIHPSRIHHEGAHLTKGKRYILVGFLGLKTDSSQWPSYWSYLWYTTVRRFGRFGHCVRRLTYTKYHYILDESSSIPLFNSFVEAMSMTFGKISLSTNSEHVQVSSWYCKSVWNIYGYEAYVLYRDMFFADERRYAKAIAGNTISVVRLLKQASLLFLAFALVVCLIALIMMGYEYLAYWYHTKKASNNKKAK